MNNDYNPGKKPYPWRCSNCRERSVHEAVVDYVTTRHHDSRTYAIEIPGLKVSKCTHCGQVAADSDTLRAVTAAFLVKAKLLTPQQICDGRKGSNLTQGELAAALGIAETTVAYWEEGDVIQSRSEDNLLRLFFGLPQVREILIAHQVSSLDLAPA